MQSLVSENDAANPEGGVLENVPSTVVAPVPGPPDFNGASAVVARLPNIGFAPSLLTEKGFETRGSFTIRKSRAGESFYLRVYGKLNHNIRCTLRGYRNLMGDFTGNTIYTGFKKIYTGKSQLQTGHIPRGIVGEVSTATAIATLPVTRLTLVGCWGWQCRFSYCRFLAWESSPYHGSCSRFLPPLSRPLSRLELCLNVEEQGKSISWHLPLRARQRRSGQKTL